MHTTLRRLADALTHVPTPTLFPNHACRYTLFYVLYPLGAGSEAMLIFSTLPSHWPWQAAWSFREYVYAGLFAIWWPGLYVMYTHMIKQRKRAIGKGFWGDKLAEQKVERRRAAIREAAKKIK